MNFLLDTNACIALMKGRPPAVRSNFQSAITAHHAVFVSSVVAFELWYGQAKSAQPELNRRRLEQFLAGEISVLSFDHEDAEAAGAIRAVLEASGRPIGAYDLLIAGQALRRKFTLVTANVTAFARIKGLAWQDWSKLA